MKDQTPLFAKISSKNQIVIPAEARSVLDLSSGDEVALIPKGNIFILFKKPQSYKNKLSGIISSKVGESLRNELKNRRDNW